MRPGARAAALSALALSACARTQAPPPEAPSQVIEGLSLSQATRGRKDWRLESRLALLRDDRQEAQLTEPRMEFYKAGRLASRARSLTGTVDTESHDVVLSSSVVVSSLEDGSVLETEELRYSSRDKRFRTDKPILAKRPDGVLRGRGLEATPDLSEIRIFSQESVIKRKKK